MKKIIVLLFSVIVISCQRFDDSFFVHSTINDFIENFEKAITSGNSDEISTFFDNDYLNDGKTKEQIIDYWLNLSKYSVKINILDRQDLKIKCQLFASNNTEIIIDTIFVDELLYTDESFKFLGNRAKISFENFISSYKDAVILAIETSNFSPLREYFSESYLNDGVNYEGFIQGLQNLSSMNLNELQFKLVKTDYFEESIEYHLMEENLDIPFIQKDIFSVENGRYVFLGNQKNTNKNKKVMAIFFTGYGCTSCVFSEDALFQLQKEMNGEFIFVENHAFGNDPMVVDGNREEMQYYGINFVPQVVLDGTEIVSHYGEETYNYYKYLVNRKLLEPVKILLQECKLTTNSDSIFVKTKIDYISDENFEDLILGYYVIEKFSRYINASNSPYKNVVLVNGKFSLPKGKIQNEQSFAFGIPDLPDDAQIVIYLQNRKPIYTDDCEIFDYQIFDIGEIR